MLPDLIPVRQRFGGAYITDLPAAMQQALQALNLHERIRPGMRVGIPAGSRGIRHIPVLLREIVAHVRALGAEPVVVAAMGSHGGGTPEGQAEVLHSLGVTEASIGAPLHTAIDAHQVGATADGTPVYFDRTLLGCDQILVLNRVKPHTSFRGRIESGLVKMLVVGCGKPVGARLFHSLGLGELAPRLLEMGQILLGRLPVAGGIAVLEDPREETADLVPVRPEEFIAAEERLLERAKQMLPRLPVEELDLLVIDQMGKNFSGTGIDTNIVGRTGVPELKIESPRVRRLVILDLSEESHGNANGVGLADLVTRRLVGKVDYQATYLNVLTAMALERAKIPMTLETDRAVVETALRTLSYPENPRIVRIKNTLELENLWVSPAVLAELQGDPRIEVTGLPAPWPFGPDDNLF